MADTNVRVVFSAEGLEGLTSKLTSFAGVLGGVFAGKKILDFGIEAVKGFAEAEAATTRVNTVLKTLGQVGEQSRDKLFEMSKAAVKLGFDDEAAAESLAKFLQRTGDLKDAQELASVAMDLARAKTIDLGTATTLVNQVLSGNGRVLKQYGIDIKETASPLEALGILHDRVRGQAEAFATTTQGNFAILSETFANFRDELGGALVEGLKPFIDEMLKFVGDPATQIWFKDMAHAVGEVLKFAFTTARGELKIFSEILTEIFLIAFKVSDFFKGAFAASVKFISDAFEGLKIVVDSVTGSIQKVIDLAARATSAVQRFGGNIAGGAQIVGNALLGRAGGGDVTAGTPYMVGEMGPEMFIPRVGGTIVPNSQLGSGITINITGNTLLSDRAGDVIAEKIMRTLKANLRI